MDDFLREYQWAMDDWSCMYSAQRAMDGDPATAWCEGAPDEGIGETVVVRADLTRPLKIWAGLGQSPEAFKKNGRPRRILVTVLRAERADAHQYGTVYQNLRVLGQAEGELDDVFGLQALPLPAFAPDPEMAGLGFVAIKILSVYPGLKYKDTCISEVSN